MDQDRLSKCNANTHDYSFPCIHHSYWKDAADACSKIALANGFAKTEWANIPGKLMFVVHELVCEASQAIECGADRQGMDGLEEELADVVIRLLAMLNDLYGGEWTDRSSDVIPDTIRVPWVSFPQASWGILQWISRASEYWRHGNVGDVQQCLEFAVAATICLARSIKPYIDIHEEVRKKCAINMARPSLHGKRENLG